MVKNQLLEMLKKVKAVVTSDGEQLDPVVGLWVDLAALHTRSPLPLPVVEVTKRSIRREVFCPGTDEDKIAVAIYDWFTDRASIMEDPFVLVSTRAELKKKTEEVDRKLLSVLATFFTS